MINLDLCSYKDILINYNGEVLLYLCRAPYDGYLTVFLECQYGKKPNNIYTIIVEEDDIIEIIKDD